MEVEKVDLFYLPLWLLEYRYGQKAYKALINASSGQVMAAEYPVGKLARIINFNLLFLILAAVFAFMGSGSEGSGTFMYLLAGVFGGTALLYTVLRSIRPLRL